MEKESKKQIITREKIVKGLKGEAKHMVILFSSFTFGLSFFLLLIGGIINFRFHGAGAFVFGIFAALDLFFVSAIVFYIVRMFLYGTDKLLIVEDKLYKTIPYEKINRAASSKYTIFYDHGLYFKQYGKFTVTSTSLSIDFDGNSDYYLVVLNGKKLYTGKIDPLGFADAAIDKNYTQKDYHTVYVYEIEEVLIAE